MHDDMITAGSPQAQKSKPAGKKHRGNRTLTIIFYTLYCILIVSFLAGLHFLNIRLEETLVQYEESHISVQSEAIFTQLFGDPDWVSLYEMAGIQDTAFEGADAYASRMEATVCNAPLTYEEIPADHSGHAYLVLLGNEAIGGFTVTNQRESGARWPSWQLESISLEVPRDITVQVRKLDEHTVTVNGIALDEAYTIRIDTLLSEEYTLPGTTGIAMELQQISGLLVTPEIAILDEAGNPCPLTIDPETGIYEEQLPEAAALSSQQTRFALDAANSWAAYKLRSASEGNLSLFFNPRENAYRTILSESFWLTEPAGYTVESLDILASQVYSQEHFSAYISFSARLNGTDTVVSKSATFFFELHRGSWSCYEIQPGSVYTDVTKVRLSFLVDNQEVYYDFYETDRTSFFAPVITVPEGFSFAGWAAADSTGSMQIVFTSDETGFITIPQDMVLEPMSLHAIFEEAKGGA